MRDYSIPALAQITDRASLADVVFSRAARPAAGRGHAAPGRGDGTWHDVTAAVFRDEVTGLARGLVAAGVEPGDRVGLMSRTRYEWTLIDYAIWAAGAVTVPVYETSSAEQVEWILADSGARFVFAETAAHAGLIGGLRDRLPGLSAVWEIGGLAELTAGGSGVTDEQVAGAAGRPRARMTWPRSSTPRAPRDGPRAAS